MALNRLVTLSIVLCSLAACDDASKPKQGNVITKEETHTAPSKKLENFQKQDVNDKSAMQAMILEGIKKKLPILIDQATQMTEVSTKDNVFIYHYEVKGIPVSVMNTHYWQENMKKGIQVQYCKNDDNIKIFKDFFTGGSIYNYFVENKLIYTTTITPEECHEVN